MKKIIALSVCHNRINFTLSIIGEMYDQYIPEGYELIVCIVDDGSTDGTYECILNKYPKVVLLKGSGDLYWSGGMRFGWDNFVKAEILDYLLVFNDDIKLNKKAIYNLIKDIECFDNEKEAIAVTGSFCDPITKGTTYSGVVKESWWHPLRFKKINPSGKVQICDTLNMNFALINRKALESTDFLSTDFIHGRSDYDFGLRLKKMNGQILLSSKYSGECARNVTPKQPTTFIGQWKELVSVKNQPLRERSVYYKRHIRFLWFFYWALPYIRIPVQFWLKKISLIARFIK